MCDSPAVLRIVENEDAGFQRHFCGFHESIEPQAMVCWYAQRIAWQLRLADDINWGSPSWNSKILDDARPPPLALRDRRVRG